MQCKQWEHCGPARALRTSQVYCRPDFVPLPWHFSHFTLRARESFLQHGKTEKDFIPARSAEFYRLLLGQQELE